MSKKTAIKVGGFAAALCASAALVATAATGTGAYFTDSHDGNLASSSGHLKLNVNASDLQLSFANIMPGEDKSKTIGFTTDLSNGTEDVWLVFPSGQAYAEFSGYKGEDGTAGGLGRYGHFKVTSDQGFGFESYNLANASGVTDSTCDDSNGNGGSAARPTAETGPGSTVPYCAVPHYIKVADNIANGAGGHVTITFGLTGRQTQPNQYEGSVPFQLVGTQHNVRPDAGNF